MSRRDAAPLTARLLARKSGAAPSGSPQPDAAQAAPPAGAKAPPPVRNVHPASPTVHAIDLTPPDFLRAETRAAARRQDGGDGRE